MRRVVRSFLNGIPISRGASYGNAVDLTIHQTQTISTGQHCRALGALRQNAVIPPVNSNTATAVPYRWQHQSMGLLAASARRGLFIQTQSTPNPQSLMFQPGKTIMESGSKMFPNARAAMVSPLATRLFQLDGVTSVMFGSDFITVTKKDDAQSWATLKPDIFAAITDHLSSGEPLLLDEEEQAASDTAIHPDDSEVVAMIKELLETRIRPAVQEDGGDIRFKSFDVDTGVVTVKMLGSCSGCPSSTVTLKSGVENMLMHYVPEVTSVVEEEDDEHEGVKALADLEAKLKDKGP